MRFFDHDIRYLDRLWRAFTLPPPSEKSNQATIDYLLQFRNDFNAMLIQAGTTLPEAYTEYALQRLYLHQSRYLLRDTEIAENSGTQRFANNRLSKHLLEKSKRHIDWLSVSNDTINFLPIKFEDLKPLSSAAATLTIPTDTDPKAIPDTLTFNFSLSGNAKINQNMREEGIRLLIIRAKDQHGTPVASNPIMYVTDLDDPVNVPLSGGVSHLVFLAMNAYVDETVTTINIKTTEQDLRCPPEGILIGKLCWMRENLDVDVGNNVYPWYPHLIDGNPVWITRTEYGRLYDWETAIYACESIGWRLPSEADWILLSNTLGGRFVAGGKLKSTKTVDRIYPNYTNPEGHPYWYNNVGTTDEIGFSAFPGGYYAPYAPAGLEFQSLGSAGYWWTNTFLNEDSFRFFQINSSSEHLHFGYNPKWVMHSVRCVRDAD